MLKLQTFYSVIKTGWIFYEFHNHADFEVYVNFLHGT